MVGELVRIFDILSTIQRSSMLRHTQKSDHMNDVISVQNVSFGLYVNFSYMLNQLVCIHEGMFRP